MARAFEPLSKAVVKQIAELGVNKIKVVDTSVDEGIVIKCLKKDPAKNEEEALKDIYRRLRPGDPPTAANARALLKRLFFDPKRYDLGRVGRYKINQKLGIKGEDDSRILTKDDLVAATKYLLRLKKGEGSLDDIDHLGSRRIRTVGELLANQCRVGLARTERLVKERMTLFDQSVEAMTPQKLINPKALSAVIRDFFGRIQLEPVHGPDQSAGRIDAQAPPVGPRAGRLVAATARASKSATCIRRTTAAFVRLKRRKARTSA